MNETTKYMSLEECRLYKELATKYGEPMFTMSASLPCFQPHLKIKNSSKHKPKRKPKNATATGLD